MSEPKEYEAWCAFSKDGIPQSGSVAIGSGSAKFCKMLMENILMELILVGNETTAVLEEHGIPIKPVTITVRDE